MGEEEIDVLVIGSGFGGSVAALRFAEAGRRVVVLERGDRVDPAKFQADIDFFWDPPRAAYGFHELRRRGAVRPWLGAAVGGGSHVYAGTLKRARQLPGALAGIDLDRHYERAEAMLGATPYPAYEPYASMRATRLLLGAGRTLAAQRPDLVADAGPLKLGIAFAPPGATPGATFTNAHGAPQRTWDPREQSILGGDIGAKNTLDKNYLFLAERAGAEIRPLCEADRIERTDGGFRVHYARYRPPTRFWERVRRRWLPARPPPATEPAAVTAKQVVIAAGAVGSTELLLRNRDVHRTLQLPAALGTRYTTNGDHVTLMLPWRGLALAWGGFLAGVICLALHAWWGAVSAAGAYWAGLLLAHDYQPDLGTTNSDGIAFRDGSYIESGRYPTPTDLIAAAILSALTGRFHARSFRWIHALGRILYWSTPPFGALARTWPIPLLCMGRDAAVGSFRLVGGRVAIDIDLRANRSYYAALLAHSRLLARAANTYAAQNPGYLVGAPEIPHNLGGVPVGTSAADGVVDDRGRVFGVPGLYVLDGSILPATLGPNPALTITALAERAMELTLADSRPPP